MVLLRSVGQVFASLGQVFASVGQVFAVVSVETVERGVRGLFWGFWKIETEYPLKNGAKRNGG